MTYERISRTLYQALLNKIWVLQPDQKGGVEKNQDSADGLEIFIFFRFKSFKHIYFLRMNSTARFYFSTPARNSVQNHRSTEILMPNKAFKWGPLCQKRVSQILSKMRYWCLVI